MTACQLAPAKQPLVGLLVRAIPSNGPPPGAFLLQALHQPQRQCIMTLREGSLSMLRKATLVSSLSAMALQLGTMMCPYQRTLLLPKCHSKIMHQTAVTLRIHSHQLGHMQTILFS